MDFNCHISSCSFRKWIERTGHLLETTCSVRIDEIKKEKICGAGTDTIRYPSETEKPVLLRVRRSTPLGFTDPF